MTHPSSNTLEEPATRRAGLWLRLAHAACVAVALLAVGLFIVGLPLYYTSLSTPCAAAPCQEDQLTAEQIQASALSLDVYVAWRMAFLVIGALAAFAVAGIILWRRPADRMALFVGTMLALIGGTHDPSTFAVHGYPMLFWLAKFVGIIGSLFIWPFVYLFPDGRFVPRWTRWLMPALLVVVVRPFVPTDLGDGLFLLFLCFWVPVGVYAQVYRYRHVSTTIQRQQSKWVIFGYSSTLTVILIVGLIITLFPSFYRPGSLGQIVLDTAFYLVASLISLSLGLAILRYRLYDIDIIIRRTLVYSILTLILGLIYVGCILLLRTLIAPLTGGSEIAIVASTLAIAALFTPLRRRIQQIIDKRFYRRKYDAAKVLAAFAARLRDETDLERLTAEMLRVVDETMQPEFVGLWLRESGREEKRRNG
jgi:hypothetical protein